MLSPLYFYLRRQKKVKNHTRRKISTISRPKKSGLHRFFKKSNENWTILFDFTDNYRIFVSLKGSSPSPR